MSCPICSGNDLPLDADVIEKNGSRVYVQGTIKQVKSRHTRPYKNYFTISLQPDKDSVKHLKFNSEEEMKKLNFTLSNRYRCEGCLHRIDNKDVVLDITNVEFLEYF